MVDPMELKRGQVVFSNAGRDQGRFAVGLEDDGVYAVICDGARRTLEAPKRKKHLHLSKTLTFLSEEEMRSDRAIKKALRRFSEHE